MSAAPELEELEAIAQALLERIRKAKAAAGPAPAVHRTPPPEAYAKVMARRRKRGR